MKKIALRLTATRPPLAFQLAPPGSAQAVALAQITPGPAGPPGDASAVTVGPAPLSGHTAVGLDASGLLRYADCTDTAHIGTVTGVLTSAYSPGEMATVQADRVVTHAGWAWAPGLPVYVGASGALVQTLPGNAVFAQVMGFALSASRLHLSIQPPITIT